MRILVTGASGFVGKYLVDRLANTDEVNALVFGSADSFAELLPKRQVHTGDLTDQSFTMSLIRKIKPDLIYHLAALSVVQNSVSRAASQLTDNLRLQYNLLEAVKEHSRNARVIAICSANEYGLVHESELPVSENNALRPLNAYAVSKVAQDMLAYQYHLANKMDIVRLRPFNHTGPGQTTDFIVPHLASQFAETEGDQVVLSVGNVETIRDFTDVRDMVDAYIMAADKGVNGEVYNIGSGIGYSVKQIIEKLESLSHKKAKIIVDKQKVRTADVPRLVADSRKFRALTGWEPKITFGETITNVYNYINESRIEEKNG